MYDHLKLMDQIADGLVDDAIRKIRLEVLLTQNLENVVFAGGRPDRFAPIELPQLNPGYPIEAEMWVHQDPSTNAAGLQQFLQANPRLHGIRNVRFTFGIGRPEFQQQVRRNENPLWVVKAFLPDVVPEALRPLVAAYCPHLHDVQNTCEKCKGRRRPAGGDVRLFHARYHGVVAVVCLGCHREMGQPRLARCGNFRCGKPIDSENPVFIDAEGLERCSRYC